MSFPPVTNLIAGSAPRGSSYLRRAAVAGGGVRTGLELGGALLVLNDFGGQTQFRAIACVKSEMSMVDWLGPAEVLGSALGGFAFGIYGLKLLFLVYGLALSFQF